jgi:chromosome segregation ATPase
MPEDNTDAKSDKTSEEEGKNTKDSAEGKDTDTSKQNQDTDKKFTQDDIDRIARKTRKEEQDRAKAAKDKEEKERLEAEATKQGEFQKLADERKLKIDELEPKVAALEGERDTLKTTLAEIAEAELKELPKEVSDISPAQRAEDRSLTNPLDVLAWLPKGKALAEKLNGQSGVKGTPKSPRANGTHGDTKTDERARAEARRAYRD